MFEYEPFSPHELLLDIGDEWTARAEAKGIELLVASPPGPQAGANFSSDRARLRQIVSNLVSNAIKYTPAGKVVLSAAMTGDKLRIGVSDTGIGIDAEHHRRIFLPHVRVAGNEEETDGSGLGLAIVEKLSQSLGGRLELHSERGRGSTFAVILPQRFGGAIIVPAHAGPPAGI
jgi:signal transduction histidine kinase